MSTNLSLDLVEELDADYHQLLLETGNLKNLSSGSHKWTGKDCWLSEGFVARGIAVFCTNCQKTTFELLGIFTLESNAARNASRLTPITHPSDLPKHPADKPFPIELSETSAIACAACLPSLGFLPLAAAFIPGNTPL